MREDLQYLSTGALFYLTNIVCPFLWTRVWYKTQPAMRLDTARFGIAVENDRYWSDNTTTLCRLRTPKNWKTSTHRSRLNSLD